MKKKPSSPAGHFTPLRYPGGKGKVAGFVDRLLEDTGLLDGTYVEPYAGGAAVAVELLLRERVSRIELNDISPHVHAFWHSVLNHVEDLCLLIQETQVTVESWDAQKVIAKSGTSDLLALGFATFFLNRTNRSGILNAGIIGGRAQVGAWLINARFNKEELIRRIRAIAAKKGRIGLHNEDAVSFLNGGRERWSERTFLYLDPPYFVKGRDLYFHHYSLRDHQQVRDAVAQLTTPRWIVSYDDVPEIFDLYSEHSWLRYRLGYSAREHAEGAEIMFFGPGVPMPPAFRTMREIARSTMAA
ncbi:MAG: DNA adenine methylase [Pseudomonadota bacterium]